VKRDPVTGEVKNAGKPFQTWLRDVVPDELPDIHHCPAVPPFPAENEPSQDPERWGVWTDCHAILRAWRDLVRAAQVAALPTDKVVQLRYEVIPRLRAVSPSFSAFQALAGPVFQPQDGHVFVVGTLEDLKIRCLMVLCRRSGYAFHGSLRCCYFAGRMARDERYRGYSPIEFAAADFFAFATAPDVDAAKGAVRDLECQETPAQEQARLAYETAQAAYQRFCEGEEQLPAPEAAAMPSGPNPGQAVGEQSPRQSKPLKTESPETGSTTPGARLLRPKSSIMELLQRAEKGPPPSPARQALEQARQAYEEARDTPELREAEEALERAHQAIDAARTLFLRLRVQDRLGLVTQWHVTGQGLDHLRGRLAQLFGQLVDQVEVQEPFKFCRHVLGEDSGVPPQLVSVHVRPLRHGVRQQFV
jgi:hypothetical protein